MLRYKFIFAISLSLLINVSLAFSFALPWEDLEESYTHSELIVEGYLAYKEETAKHTIPGHVGQSDQSIHFKVGRVEHMTFRVTKVYKGFLDDSALISVYAYPQFKKDKSSLSVDKSYVLFLKKHSHKKGFEIVDRGRGKWLIFDYEGIKKVKAAYQSSSLRKAEDYLDYTMLSKFLSSK